VARLVNRYAERLDARDAEGVVACFAPGAMLSFNDGAVVHRGLAAITAVYAEALGDGPTANGTATTHLTSNLVVDLDADGARGTSSVKVVAFLRRDDVVRMRGLRFDDEVVRTDEGWRFSARRHGVDWQSQVPAAAVSVPTFGAAR
jgi:hypothetical protein